MKQQRNIFLAILFCLGALLLIWFAIPMFSGVSNIGNRLGMVFGAGIMAATVVIAQCKRRGRGRIAKMIGIIGGIVAALIVLWAGAISGLMISGVAEKAHDADATVVVLGCKVNGMVPSLHLSRRIAAASQYLQAHPEANCIASGGKGDGERISEAQAIYDRLVADGIDPSRILPEDKSVNTEENLAFSKEKIAERGWNPEVVLVTDGYHQYRANLLARRLGITSSPVSAKHTWHTFPANYARELLAITKTLLT